MESKQENIKNSNDSEWYGAVSWIFGFLAFFISWGYCIYTYGYLFGVGLGWLPSIVAAIIVGIFWPLILIGLSILALFVFKGVVK